MKHLSKINLKSISDDQVRDIWKETIDIQTANLVADRSSKHNEHTIYSDAVALMYKCQKELNRRKDFRREVK